jgi:hypothetical protein
MYALKVPTATTTTSSVVMVGPLLMLVAAPPVLESITVWVVSAAVVFATLLGGPSWILVTGLKLR